MKVDKLPIGKIIEKIRTEETFEATPENGGFIIKIDKYVPFCGTAIHNGGKLRDELKEKIFHSDYERWYEEDPHTAEFISSMPITIVGLDSRFEYDLNHTPENCIYDEAWGKRVWRRDLTTGESNISKSKHDAYYLVLGELIKKIEELFGRCVLYDFHSYNYKRWDREVPLFNVGTERLDRERFKPFIENWLSELSAINLEGITSVANENDVFFGRGYGLKFITENFYNTLVLATEVKKVYCDELSGECFQEVIQALKKKLAVAIKNNVDYFCKDLKIGK